MTKSQKEIRNGKKFRFWDFRFKIRFKTFKSIPTKKVKKIFRPKFFDLAIFSLFWPKNECPRKNFVMGKNFRFRDFRFKISLKTFWIDSEKNFWPKIFIFWSFYVKNEGFGPFLNFLGQNRKKNDFSKPFSQFYYGHFALSSRSLSSKMCKRSNLMALKAKIY